MNSKQIKNKKNYRGKTNGKGYNTKPKSGSSRKDDVDTETAQGRTKSRMNDVSWYAANPQLLTDAASVPYGLPTGQPISRYDERKVYFKEAPAMPGLCALRVAPTYGSCGNPQSSINVAANAIYTFVRHLNSGHANYDAVDLMQYIMALDSVYFTIHHCQRVLGCAPLYNQLNRYVPDTLLEAMCVKPDDLRKNLANYRTRLNMIIQKANTLCIPNNMSLFVRHSWLFSNVYTEGDSWKDQLYLYVPDGLYQFTHDTEGAGMLKWLAIGETAANFSSWLDTLEQSLDPLLADEDIGIMSGDILKAYGEAGIWRLAMIPEEYGIAPIYEPEVLEQMHNATIVPITRETGTFDIVQDVDEGYLKYKNGVFTIKSVTSQLTSETDIVAYGLTRPALVTTNKNAPTAADTMVNTRLTLVAHDVQEATSATDSASFSAEIPTEIVVRGTIYTLYRNSAGSILKQAYNFYGVMIVDSTGSIMAPNYASGYMMGSSAFIAFDANFAHFKYAPGYVPVDYVMVGETASYLPCPWDHRDIDNYAVIDEPTLSTIHTVAVLSEFNVPYVTRTK